MNKGNLIKLISLTALISIVACGVSQKSLDDAQGRMDALKAKGIPDSLLSKAKVHLYQAKDESKRKNNAIAKKAIDSCKIVLTQLEKSFNDDLTRIIPEIDALKGQINQTKSEVTGMQTKRIDSLLAVVDSLAGKKLYPEAYTKVKEVVAVLPQIKMDEQKARETRSKVVGTWTCTNVTKHSEDKTVNAVEKKIFIFGNDGKCRFIENKKGKSGPFLKEDYEYISYGTWDMKGDTAYLKTNRFVAVKQKFERLFIEDGGKKRIWKPDNHPSYDSLITDGSQDRYVAFPDLKSDFVHSR